MRWKRMERTGFVVGTVRSGGRFPPVCEAPVYVKYLSVTGVGRIGHAEFEFGRGVTRTDIRFADEICFAVGAVTANGAVKEMYPPLRADRRSIIKAEIEAGGKSFAVTASGRHFVVSAETDVPGEEYETGTDEYLSLMKRSAFEDRLCLIDVLRDPEYHDLASLAGGRSFGNLQRMTDGIGTTRSFRAALNRYLATDSFAPEEGFDLLSMLDAVCFWDRFGKTRDMHYDPKPLIIVGPSDGDEKKLAEIRDLIERQIIIV